MTIEVFGSLVWSKKDTWEFYQWNTEIYLNLIMLIPFPYRNMMNCRVVFGPRSIFSPRALCGKAMLTEWLVAYCEHTGSLTESQAFFGAYWTAYGSKLWLISKLLVQWLQEWTCPPTAWMLTRRKLLISSKRRKLMQFVGCYGRFRLFGRSFKIYLHQSILKGHEGPWEQLLSPTWNSYSMWQHKTTQTRS